MGGERLSVVSRGAGMVEWQMSNSVLTVPDALFVALVGALSAVLLASAGWEWASAAPVAAVVALGSFLLQTAADVASESLTYTRHGGVRLETQRRVGAQPAPRFVPLRRIDGLTMHEEGGGLKKLRHCIAITLKPDTSITTATAADGCGGDGAAAGGAADEMVEAELAFANLQPPLRLLRQIYDQLKPLLDADLAEAAASGAGASPARKKGPPAGARAQAERAEKEAAAAEEAAKSAEPKKDK